MRNQMTKARIFMIASLVAAMAALGIVPAASAHTGLFTKFNQCPSTNPEVLKCINSVTTGGEVVLGNKKVPIVNPVVLQGGLSAPASNFRTMIAPTSGPTLQPVPQPVPGGLAGLVNCKEISNFLVRLGCEAVFENGLTGVNATLELAGPPSAIVLNEVNLALGRGTALEMPVKVHLENPLLGSGCYVGSNHSPMIWKLTTAPRPRRPGLNRSKANLALPNSRKKN